MKTRPPIERMAIIYGLLLRQERCTTKTLGAQLEVSRKGVSRDLEFMRDRLGLPITYDSSNFTWCLDARTPRPWWLARPSDKEFRSIAAKWDQGRRA